MANDCRGDADELYGFKEVPPRHQLHAGDLWGGSRATSRAFGCVRSGVTAGAMAINADAMVARLDLVKINMSFIITIFSIEWS